MLTFLDGMALVPVAHGSRPIAEEERALPGNQRLPPRDKRRSRCRWDILASVNAELCNHTKRPMVCKGKDGHSDYDR